MVILIGSTPSADRLEQFLRARVACERVPCPAGASAEGRFTALRSALIPGQAQAPMAVAATGEDERSLLAAGMARRLGARPTVALVQSPTLAVQGQALIAALGVDRVVEPDTEVAAAVTERLIGPVAAAVRTLGQGQIRTAELVVPAGSDAVGRPLREQALPRGARIALIRRGERPEHAIAPTAATVLEPGDRVLLVANRAVAADAASCFGGAPLAGPRVLVARSPEAPLDGQERLVRLLREAGLDASGVDQSAIEHADARAGVIVLLEPDGDLVRRARAVDTAELVLISSDSHAAPASGGRGATIIHPLDAVGSAISALLPRAAIERVGTLAPRVLDVYRVRAGESGEWLGGPLRQTPGMRGWIILATQSGENAHLPHPEDAIEPGDVLIIAGPPGAEGVLARALAGSGDGRAVA